MMKYNPARNNDFDWFNDFNPFKTTVMKTDIREKDGMYMLDIDLPGFNKEDLKISLYNGTLTVTADHHETEEEKNAKGKVVRKERYSGSMSRSWYVGDGIKETDIHASYKDGTLTLAVPTAQKHEEETTKYISIE